MKTRHIVAIIIFFFFFLNNVFAIVIKTKMHSVSHSIQNLDETIHAVEKGSPIRVVFPAVIPESKTTLYASQTSRADYWIINVDHTPTCHGAHFCNVGSISAQAKGQMDDTYMDMKKKSHTRKLFVMLADGTTAFFTPGHAEADWHNPTLEWKFNNIVYTMTWTIKGTDSKRVLTTMANSAMHPGSN